MLIDPLIPEIWLFRNLIMKIQGQGLRWGQSLRSQWLNVGTLSFLFHVNQPSHSLNMSISKFDHKIQGQGHSSRSHSGSNILLTQQIPSIPCQLSVDIFLRYSCFKFWLKNPNSRSKVKVTQLVQHLFSALAFHFTPIIPTIPKVWPIKCLTEKKEPKFGKQICLYIFSNRIPLKYNGIYPPKFCTDSMSVSYFILGPR